MQHGHVKSDMNCQIKNVPAYLPIMKYYLWVQFLVQFSYVSIQDSRSSLNA